MKRSLILPVLATLSLVACGDIREDLGLGRSAPDEFAVVDRAPLSMPPDFSLRPPKPGEARPQEVDPPQRANNILFGNNSGAAMNAQVPSDGSSAEKALLGQTGAEKANPDIRDTVDREAAERVVGSNHLVEDILWWKKDQDQSTTVDANAEAARIQAAQQNKKPLNQSATPVIERDKSGWLGL